MRSDTFRSGAGGDTWIALAVGAALAVLKIPLLFLTPWPVIMDVLLFGLVGLLFGRRHDVRNWRVPALLVLPGLILWGFLLTRQTGSPGWGWLAGFLAMPAASFIGYAMGYRARPTIPVDGRRGGSR